MLSRLYLCLKKINRNACSFCLLGFPLPQRSLSLFKTPEKNNPIAYDEIPFFPLWECKDNTFSIIHNTFFKKITTNLREFFIHSIYLLVIKAFKK